MDEIRAGLKSLGVSTLAEAKAQIGRLLNTEPLAPEDLTEDEAAALIIESAQEEMKKSTASLLPRQGHRGGPKPATIWRGSTDDRPRQPGDVGLTRRPKVLLIMAGTAEDSMGRILSERVHSGHQLWQSAGTS